VYANFRIITEWNKSLLYALSVDYLSDRLAGKKGLVGKPPPGGAKRCTSVLRAMQADLNALGFDAGEPDGMVGMPQARQALRGIKDPAASPPTPIRPRGWRSGCAKKPLAGSVRGRAANRPDW